MMDLIANAMQFFWCSIGLKIQLKRKKEKTLEKGWIPKGIVPKLLSGFYFETASKRISLKLFIWKDNPFESLQWSWIVENEFRWLKQFITHCCISFKNHDCFKIILSHCKLFKLFQVVTFGIMICLETLLLV